MMARSPHARTWPYSACSFLPTAPNWGEERGARSRATFLETCLPVGGSHELLNPASELLDKASVGDV